MLTDLYILQSASAWLLYVTLILISFFESSISLMVRMHKHAYLALLDYNISLSVAYIYAFPYVVSPLLEVTEWLPAILWYIFLGWFLFSKTASTLSNGASSLLSLRVLLPLLFVLEGGTCPHISSSQPMVSFILAHSAESCVHITLQRRRTACAGLCSAVGEGGLSL